VDDERSSRPLDLGSAFRRFVAEAERAIRFEDLAELFASGLEPPTQLVRDLVVEGQVNWMMGHPGHGKSTVAMWCALQHIESGGQVIWLDWEAGPRDTALRLVALGASPEQLVANFHYSYSPVVSADADGLASIAFHVEEMENVLVVFDSASKALSVAGLDENNPSEATQWTTHVVMPLRSLGATVLVIDHVPKTATRATPYPRRAGSKLADTEVAWYVEATESFSQSRAGEVLLSRKKDRNGVLPEEVRLSVGDGAGKLPIRVVGSGDGAGIGDAFRDVCQRVVDKLREHKGQRINATQLAGMVRGKKQTVLDAAKTVANDLGEPVRSEPGKRANEVVYWYAEDAVPEIARSGA